MRARQSNTNVGTGTLAQGGAADMRMISAIGVSVIVHAGAPAAAQPNRIVSVRTPPSAALMEFWTPQRLQAATPAPVPVVDPGVRGAVASGDSDSRAGHPA